MKLLKLLNKKNLSILLIFLFIQNSYSIEPADIWKLNEQPKKNNINNSEIIESEILSTNSIFKLQSEKKNEISIYEDKNLLTKNTNIVGIYDPSENNLSLEMWINSNGSIILEAINKINNVNLSEDAAEILNIVLLTNSYFPEKNITREQFLKIKLNWLVKQKNLNLIETYLEKNRELENESILIKYYLDYYLSRSDLGQACEIFDKVDGLVDDDYVSKFNIYCLINSNKKEEAQLHFDLLKETGFEDIYFEKFFFYIMGYDENIVNEISEKSLLDFHLSHRINRNFKFEPKITTSKLIWKYLSSSNLLESTHFIDLEDKDKIFAIETATHDKNYDEDKLFDLYERHMFNIYQLLSVKETHKLLDNSDARALLYQCILLNKDSSEKIELIKLLKDSFEKDNISNAFDVKLVEFLKEIDETEVPSNFTSFYRSYLKKDNSDKNKIKFNNKIIHQSKLLNYFIEGLNKKNTEQDLESLFKKIEKIKKNKKYEFSIKDIILLESLKSDGIKIPEKYAGIYEPSKPNIPYDIQILINKNETGLTLLRLAEIIGEDSINEMDVETLYLIIGVLNQLDIDKLRNRILIKVLPLKV